MNILLSMLAVLLFLQVVVAQESKVLLDNEWVTVSRVTDKPGYRSETPIRKNTLLFALSEQRRRFAGSKKTTAALDHGQALWVSEDLRSGRNIGKTVGELLIVEVKKPAGSWRHAPTADDPAKWPDSLEAVRAAPRNHRIVFENELIRVLDVTVHPGENEPLHMHRMPSVLYIMAEDDIQDFDAAGNLLYDTRSQKDAPKPPYAEWMPPQAPHRVVNRSKNALRLIRVELK